MKTLGQQKDTIRFLAKQPRFTMDQQDMYNRASRALVLTGWCPVCEGDGAPARLGPWQAGDADHYAGKTCLQCEEFFECGVQPCYDNSQDCHSDADPGL